ncbi:alpha/beta fold hydrolase [Alienimonas californiensis]|uniref:Alpha/beta hydrolase family protein n=1 Tax=Alienimonas californiensis TaxID=2527989 RepID=A0A517PE53_9PLAN|nr:alpha/beta fold hydrolase [Alienimonas californiensis]QDT17657.1 Alpha/beta hydrolase family protein [Alienimonas californiensis]
MFAPFLLSAMTLAPLPTEARRDVPSADAPPALPAAGFAPLNLPFPTLGGMQFWGDVTHRAGWRIQRHAVTGHYRLLDDWDLRRAWGDRAACEAALAQEIAARNLPRPAGDVVILLHGMIRSGKCFARLAADLRTAGFTTVAVDYPSTRQSLRASAAMLDEITDRLVRDQDADDPVRLHFVCHSAGGIVLRAWGELQDDSVPVGRSVLLGVPNHGAAMADALRGMPLVGDSLNFLWGAAAAEISRGEGTLSALPAPRGTFATIAGCRGVASGYNPLIEGDDDGTVAVAEAHLVGEADHLSVRGAGHSFLMMNPEIRAATVRFLQGSTLSEPAD